MLDMCSRNLIRTRARRFATSLTTFVSLFGLDAKVSYSRGGGLLEPFWAACYSGGLGIKKERGVGVVGPSVIVIAKQAKSYDSCHFRAGGHLIVG